MFFAFNVFCLVIDKISKYKKVTAPPSHNSECTLLNEVHLNETFLISFAKTPTNGKRPKNCATAITERANGHYLNYDSVKV